MYLVDTDKMERALRAISILSEAGFEATYAADYDAIIVSPQSVLDAGPVSPRTSETRDVSLQEMAESAVSDIITLGERIRERKLGSYFERQNLRRAGTLARNLFKKKHGTAPERNSKKTLVYPKTEIALLDEAINTVLEQIASKKES